MISRSGLLVVFLSCLAGTAHAQRVAGRVLDETTGRPVVGAIVTVVDPAGRLSVVASSDSVGAWGANLRSPGRYLVRVERLGYARIETSPFVVGTTAIFLDLATRPEVIVLEPLSAAAANLAGLLARSRTHKAVRTLLPEDVDRRIEKIDAGSTGEFLRMMVAGMSFDGQWPRMRGIPLMSWQTASRGMSFGPANFRSPFEQDQSQQSFRRECNAIIALDGFPIFRGRPETVLERVVPLEEIRAVEVFNDPNQLPRELDLEAKRNPLDPPIGGLGSRWGEDEARCGVVAIWTRAGLGIP